jgi:hypothetical protein
MYYFCKTCKCLIYSEKPNAKLHTEDDFLFGEPTKWGCCEECVWSVRNVSNAILRFKTKPDIEWLEILYE